MAKSGVISLGVSKQLKGQIVWSSYSNGTEANSSTITADLQVARTNNYTTYGPDWSYGFQVGPDATSTSWSGSVSSSWVTIASKTITKPHNDDGTGTCYIYGSVSGPSDTTLAGATVTGSETITLDTIPRQASLTYAPDFTDVDNPTITYKNPAGNSVSDLQACISLTGSAADVSYRAISKTGTSYTFNLTDSERDVLRNATTGKNRKVIFYIRCKIGSSTYYSTLEKTFTITKNSKTMPTLTDFSMQDTRSETVAMTGNSSTIIGGLSKPKISIKSSGKYNATITKVIYSSNGFSPYNGSSDVISGEMVYNSSTKAYETTIDNPISNSYTITTTDSRGFTNSGVFTTGTFIKYHAPYNGATIAERNGATTEVLFDLNLFYCKTPITDSSTGNVLQNNYIATYQVEDVSTGEKSSVLQFGDYIKEIDVGTVKGESSIEKQYNVFEVVENTSSDDDTGISIPNPLNEFGEWDYAKEYKVYITLIDTIWQQYGTGNQEIVVTIPRTTPVYEWYKDSSDVYHFNVNGVIEQNNNPISGNLLDLLLARPIGEFTIWEGNKLIVGNSTWTHIATYYALKDGIISKFPLQNGFKRTAKLFIDEVDNKASGNIYVKISALSGSYSKEYLFPITWGDTVDGIRSQKWLEFDWNNLPTGHIKVEVTPDFATNGTVRFYKIYLLIYDKQE